MDNPVELVIGLILAATVLATIARRIGIPYPVLLVLGGLVLGFVPGLPKVVIPPDVVFLIFIPPLVYIAAAQVTLRDFRNNLRPILLLSIGLVIATLCFVAGVTVWGVEGFTWTTGFLLASIIGPTDTVAVNAITGEVAIPRRVGVILEGESLVNDIVALVAYKIAVDAVMTGTISLASASYLLAWGSIGGIGIGFFVGVAAAWVRKRLVDPSVNIAASLLTAFAAYLAAEAVHASGILATVTAGLYVGRRLSKILPPEGRLQAYAFWETITFLLEGLAFVLIGLELRTIMDDLAYFSLTTLFIDAALVSGAVILLRLVWVFPFSYLPRYFSRRIREKDPYPPWQHIFLIGWAGMRGVDSLAAALALPLVLPNQVPFPQRNLILFLAFSVILSTLVLQGLSLPLLIRWMRVKEDNQDQREESQARLAAAQAALQRLEEEEIVKSTSHDVLLRLRGMYEHRVQRFQAQLNPNDDGVCEEIIGTLHQLLIDLLHTERRVVIELRDQGIISDDVLRRIERSLDFEELRLMH